MEITQRGKRAVKRHGAAFMLSWGAKRVAGLMSQSLRVLPDFIIIGAQRSGSTSLYKYLIQHPGVLPGSMKEVHFFDAHYQKGVSWYRSFFPLAATMQKMADSHDGIVLTGEATPYYLFYPHAPQRIHDTLPKVKLIAILRNPVERAYSHYQHEVQLGVEQLSFSEAIEREKSEIPAETKKILEDEMYLSFSHQNYSYLSRGRYIEQMELWGQHIPMKDLLVLKSEDLFTKPGRVLQQACDFLGVEYEDSSDFQVHNSLPYQDLDPEMHAYLSEYFRPFNARLYDFLDMDFNWENLANQ
jgi:hypothetical protein